LISLKTGAGAQTNKPVLYKPDRQFLVTADRNNEQKFIFISDSNKVDYRELIKINGNNNILKESVTLDNVNHNVLPKKKFPWSEEHSPSSDDSKSGIVSHHTMPVATFVTIRDNDSSSDPEYDSCEDQNTGNLIETCKKLSSEVKDLKSKMKEKDERIKDLEEQLRYFKNKEKF